LLRVKVAEILELPIGKGLRVTVEAVLEHHEASVVRGANHEGEEASVGDSAAILAANVNEDGPLAIPVLITHPVALIVGSIIKVIEVVNLVLEDVLLELSHVNRGPLRGG
jgi:hypothetical protein